MRHIDCIAAFTVNLVTAWLKSTASRSIAFGTLIFCPSPCSSWTRFSAFFWAFFGGCERQACECFFTVSSHSLDSSSWLLSRNHEDLIAVFFIKERAKATSRSKNSTLLLWIRVPRMQVHSQTKFHHIAAQSLFWHCRENAKKANVESDWNTVCIVEFGMRWLCKQIRHIFKQKIIYMNNNKHYDEWHQQKCPIDDVEPSSGKPKICHPLRNWIIR